jgi:hypothetical protein
LGRHFWPDFAFLYGIRIDYLSPTIYLIDIIAFLLMIFNLKKIILCARGTVKWIVLFVIFNILVAGNRWVAGLAWLRVLEIWAVYNILKENGELVKKYLFYLIPFWVILESGLGLLQIIRGESLQGIFYWLGERRFNLNTIGIAKISVFGHETLRAYGTFSHPNSMAGFLLVVLELWKNYKKDLWYWVVRWFGIFGILICASRVGILLLPIYLWPMVLVFSGWDSLSLIKRIDLNIEAIKMIFHYPLLGVGLNNYLLNSKYFQPVHNVYLLILSQVGIVGVWFIYKIIRLLRLKILWIVLVTAMFDHYWMTLPQNWWLLVLALI